MAREERGKGGNRKTWRFDALYLGTHRSLAAHNVGAQRQLAWVVT